MDKIISARVPERTAHAINALARRLRTSKKKVIVQAVAALEAQVQKEEGRDILAETWGAWGESEHPRKTVERIRKAFRKSMERHREMLR